MMGTQAKYNILIAVLSFGVCAVAFATTGSFHSLWALVLGALWQSKA